MEVTRRLIESYEQYRPNPYPNPWTSLVNWFGRTLGSKRAFASIRDHDVKNAMRAQNEIIDLLKYYRVGETELADIVVYLDILIRKMKHRTGFLVHLAFLFAALVSVYKMSSDDSYGYLLTAVSLGVLSLLMVAERTYLFKYQTIYEELKVLLERELELMKNS